MLGAVSAVSLGIVSVVGSNFPTNNGGSLTEGRGPETQDNSTAHTMGAVKSRPLTTADTLPDEIETGGGGGGGGGGSSSTHYGGSSSGSTAAASSKFNSSGFLQKHDLRYDIGTSSQYHHVRQPSVRSRSQQPMPTTEELDRRFAKVLVSSNSLLSKLVETP